MPYVLTPPETQPQGYVLKPPGEEKPSVGSDIVQTLPGIVPRAAAGLVGFPHAVAELGHMAVKKLGGYLGVPDDVAEKVYKLLTPAGAALRQLPNPGAITEKGWDEIFKAASGEPMYRPQTGPGRVVDTTGQILVSGPGSVTQKVVTGAAAGLSGEAARQFTKDPILIGLAQMLGAGAASIPFILRSVPAENIKNALEGVTPEQLKKAQALMDDARKMGTPITGAEALSQVVGKNKLQDIQRVVESSKGGTLTEPMMNARPAANRKAFETTADEIAAPPASPAETPVKLKTAAEGAVRTAEQARTNAAKPFYAAAEGETVTKGLEPFLGKIDAEIQRVGPNSVTGKELAKFREAVAPGGQPLQQVSHMDSIYKEWRDNVSRHPADPNAMQQATKGVVKPLVKEFGDIIEYFSPSIEKGRQAYQAATKTTVAPVKNSPVGDLAQGTATNAEAAMKEQSGILMPQAPRALDPITIRSTVERLNKQNPTAAREWTRQNLEGIFNEAAQNNVGGANQYGGAKFAAQVAGNQAQRDNLQALVESTGGKKAWVGFNRMLDVMEAQGKRMAPGSQTAQNLKLADELSKGGYGTTLALIPSPGRLSTFIYDQYQNFRYGKNTTEMAKILTDPKSVELMQKLAHEAPNTAKAQALTAQILVSASAARPDSGSR